MTMPMSCSASRCLVGRNGVAQDGFDAGIHLSMRELGCDPDAVHDCFLIRRSVANNANTSHTQQRSPAILGVVQALLEVIERTTREQRTNLRGDSGFERFAQRRSEELCSALDALKGDIADESVTYSDIAVTVEKISPFDVANKIDSR